MEQLSATICSQAWKLHSVAATPFFPVGDIFHPQDSLMLIFGWLPWGWRAVRENGWWQDRAQSSKWENFSNFPEATSAEGSTFAVKLKCAKGLGWVRRTLSKTKKTHSLSLYAFPQVDVRVDWGENVKFCEWKEKFSFSFALGIICPESNHICGLINYSSISPQWFFILSRVLTTNRMDEYLQESNIRDFQGFNSTTKLLMIGKSLR